MSDLVQRLRYNATLELVMTAADRIEALEAALRFLFEETKWKSVDKDNMEFEGHVTCYQLDKARAALARDALNQSSPPKAST